jgi:hypothetical protein
MLKVVRNKRARQFQIMDAYSPSSVSANKPAGLKEFLFRVCPGGSLSSTVRPIETMALALPAVRALRGVKAADTAEKLWHSAAAIMTLGISSNPFTSSLVQFARLLIAGA